MLVTEQEFGLLVSSPGSGKVAATGVCDLTLVESCLEKDNSPNGNRGGNRGNCSVSRLARDLLYV